MTTEQDTPPQRNTFRRFVWETIGPVAWARAFWGRRLVGGAIGLMSDLISESATQAFYARLPGHAQQAPDSLTQVGKDRDLFRFRGETDANWADRVLSAWDDYEQAGTNIQMLHVINQWGTAGWAASWPSGTVTLVESGNPVDWSFTITIPFGMIDPPLIPTTYGSGHVYGELGLFYGIGPSTDLSVLLYLVRKWKRSPSVGYVKVYYSVSGFVQFTVR